MRHHVLILLMLCTACGYGVQPTASQSRVGVPAKTVAQADAASLTTTPNLDQPTAPAVQPTKIPSTVTEARIYTSSDLDLVETLEERVGRTPIIMIGRVTEAKEFINTSRDVNDDSKPAPQTFALGQVYGVEVERYLKGDGPTTVNVVQAEGATIYNDDGPPDIPSTPEEVAQLKAAYPHIPLRANTRYLFFLLSMPGFDPALNYRAGGALGEPWRFALPLTGNAEAESAEREAVDAFPPLPSADLVGQVEQLVQTQQ